MLLVMAVIFFLSHQPGESLDLPDIPNLDKLLHGLVYGVLAMTVIYARSPDRVTARPVHAFFLTVFWCVLYGISDELHQSFVPGRCPSAWDLAADTLGAVLGAVLFLVGRRSPVARLLVTGRGRY